MFSNLGSKGNYIATPWNKHQDTLIWQNIESLMVLIKNFGEDQGSLLEASSLLSSASHAILECFLLFPAILLWNIKWFSGWIRVYISMCHTKEKKKTIPLLLPGCPQHTLSTLFRLDCFQAKSLFSTHWPIMENKEYRNARTVSTILDPNPSPCNWTITEPH